MNTACAEELNQLLKGTHMGASLFEDLKANVRDDQLRRIIDDCLKRLRKHEELLTHHVELSSTMEYWPSNLLFQVNEFLILRYLQYRDTIRKDM